MTDIPGTGKVTPKPVSVQTEPVSHLENISVVNVGELNKKDWEKEKPGDLLWYNKLSYWVLFGAGVGFIFVILALIINKRFIFIAPLGPIIGFTTWHVKKFVGRFEERNRILK